VYVRWLEVSAFRNYPSLAFTPDPGLNALTGPNGQGKTSLLEALHVLLAGRSFRTPRLRECVARGAAAARVAGELADGERRRELHLTLSPAGERGVLRGDLCPWARVVSFAATDLELVAGGPPLRRAYLDGLGAKVAPAHAEACRRYRLVLLQRGRLLSACEGRSGGERLLAPWEEQLAALGSEIVHRRLEVLATVAREMGEIWRVLAPDAPPLALRYEPVVAPGTEPGATRERLRAALAARRAEEARRGLTLSGPHRDDFGVRLGGADVRAYASRGVQRLLALALRLAEAAVVERRIGTSPVLLLDDLLSELDRPTRERVLAWLAARGQVLFSTTDAAPGGGATAAWEVRDGAVAAPEPAGARGRA
jgi:DNA replication and repair protein RecF